MNDELLRRLDALEALEAAGLPQDDLSLEDLTASIEGDDGGGKAGEP